MAPTLSEDEIDDLIYFARVGEMDDLKETLVALAEREKVSEAEILIAAKDEGKSTALHMATGNGHLGTLKTRHSILPCPHGQVSGQPCRSHDKLLTDELQRLYENCSNALMTGQRKKSRRSSMMQMSMETLACIGPPLADIWIPSNF